MLTHAALTTKALDLITCVPMQAGKIFASMGYVRVTANRKQQAPGWEDQIDKFEELGCDRFLYEEASTRSNRPEFTNMREDANRDAKSDQRFCLAAAKMDRVFRDLASADAAITRQRNPDVFRAATRALANPLDPKDLTQVLLVPIMAQFERVRLAERRAYENAKAKREGEYRGRKPTARAKTPKVLKLRESGFRPDEIVKQLEIGRASVFRILRAHRAAGLKFSVAVWISHLPFSKS